MSKALNKLRGRFSGDMGEMMKEFSSSIDIDKEMIPEDIWGNQAHVLMLAKKGIIEKKDAKKILKALEKAKEDFLKGKFMLNEELEDVHMNVEAYVTELIGEDAGGKIHTARSRNDQVLTDTRLHLRARVIEVEEHIIHLQKTFVSIAKKSTEKVMPGYTHTQQAQPITLGFWATAYASILNRDLERLRKAYENINRSPLGACALAGTSFAIDRRLTARLLGFDDVIEHSLDAISSRDFIIETLGALAILSSNLSRLSEELILFSTNEFGILELSDEYTTGSSIMPQKKNPDFAELSRGMTGYIYGALMQLLVTLKALPLGYNRDFQEDRVLLWKSINRVKMMLSALNGTLSTAKFKEERMRELAGGNYSTATELANYLVREEKLPFRKSHEITAKVVKELYCKKKDFEDLKLTKNILEKHDIDISLKELKNLLDPENAVRLNHSLGSTSPKEVERMIKELTANTIDAKEEIRKRQERINKAKKLTEKMIKSEKCLD